MTPRDFNHKQPNIRVDVIVIGAGAAGLYTALSCAPLKVAVISPLPLGGESSSLWAQGGIAAAVSKDDSTTLHRDDTMIAAAGTADTKSVSAVTDAAPNIIRALDGLGVAFDKDGNGDYALSREACHSVHRVLRAKAGDGFGRALMAGLIGAVQNAGHITVYHGYTAERLIKQNGQICGMHLRDVKTGRPSAAIAPHVVLATGGLGGLYQATTNPLSSVGRGVALAMAAGAELADLEFVQFHPTATDIGLDPAPLATEALRGEGAILVNDKGARFMIDAHPMAELAPRDIVSRAIFKQYQNGHKVFLDCRAIDTTKFDALNTACKKVGLDPKIDLIPVRPATHYHMGGIATDITGRTSLPGLWAAGEVASTGLHGANRLASNSLMEALVMGAGVGVAIKDSPKNRDAFVDEAHMNAPRMVDDVRAVYKRHIRSIMTDCVGVLRDDERLNQAIDLFTEIADRVADEDLEIYDMAVLGRAIAAAALARTESRGGHARSDYPMADEKQAKRSFVTYVAEQDTIEPIYEVAE